MQGCDLTCEMSGQIEPATIFVDINIDHKHIYSIRLLEMESVTTTFDIPIGAFTPFTKKSVR